MGSGAGCPKAGEPDSVAIVALQQVAYYSGKDQKLLAPPRQLQLHH
jgi:hypothetical protein